MVSKETLDETSMMDTELCGTVFCLRESINQVTSVGKKGRLTGFRGNKSALEAIHAPSPN
jgi:hypothetical protein